MDSTQAKTIPPVPVSYLGTPGIAILENLELMFSNPVDFNDPFEFLPRLTDVRLRTQSCGDERSSKARHIVRDYACNSFIFCMTDKEHNVRMWDHYGERHQGLMISLDLGGVLTEYVKRGWILPVNYDCPNRAPLITGQQTPEEKFESFKHAVTQKGKDWEPESEFRWLLPAQNCHWKGQQKEPDHMGELRVLNGKVKAFLPIPPAGILKVTVGYHSSPSLLNTVLQLRERHQAKWQVAKAMLSLDGYQFEDEIIVP